MMMTRAPGMLATFLLACSIVTSDVTIYVAPSGNDQWSGAPAEANAAGTDGPLETLEAARDRARQLRAAD
ncbi:MAG TPA: hypothetical protein DGT21_05600, partial [Armatimonadetes bacterium]|nr:hypothetical protein [Armatimonadota bacterium]